VGTFEILCGALILVGLFTRVASFPTLIIIVVAIATTKFGILNVDGFWQMMHSS